MFSPYLSPSVDWLTVTVPRDDHGLVSDDVREVLSGMPGISAAPYGWDLPGPGTIHVKPYGQVGIVSASGAAICAMRSASVWSDYLSALSAYPHRVSRLDVAMDVPVNNPSLILDRLYVGGCSGVSTVGGHVHTMKRILSPAHWDSDLETGTVYFGYRSKSRASVRVYDKRQESIDRGRGDIGSNWLRYELSLDRRVGVSMRDVSVPTAVYWHYMGGILPVPVGIPAWSSLAEGYLLERRVLPDALTRFKRRLGESVELSSLVSQANSVPGGAFALLLHLRRLKLAVSGDPDLSHFFASA